MLLARLRRRVWAAWACSALSAAGLVTGCVHHPQARDRGTVSAELNCRMGVTLGPEMCDCEITLPYGLSLANELNENEVILIALWNNAAFQETLTDLGIARGDLIQAGLLPNPEFVILFSAPDKPWRYAVDFPLEALWLRPIRVAAADRESDRVAQRLTQAGLDLIRDVRQAYADVLLARGRVRVTEEGAKMRGEIARLAEVRHKAGDVSLQEASTAKIEAHQARQDVLRLSHDVGIAEEKLRQLLGLSGDRTPLRLEEAAPRIRTDLDPEALVADAVRSRPDVLAVEELVGAAAERLRIAKIGWVRVLGIADATAGNRDDHELGPAVRATLPIFHWNQGNIARATAELDKARRQRRTMQDQVTADVRQAHLRYDQARTELEALEQVVRPEVESAIRRAESAYKEGNTPYVVVLETTRQLLDSRLRREQLVSDLRRSWADLERSVGRRIGTVGTGLCVSAPAVDRRQPTLTFESVYESSP
jgi:cobalt-zinc-cadmium efflux system outer membrane protein